MLAAKNLAEAAVAEPAGLILNQGRAVIPHAAHGQLLSESSGFSVIVKPSGVGWN